MKLSITKIYLFLSFILISSIFSCNDDEFVEISKPKILLNEVGSKNSKKAIIGKDLHIESEIEASGLIDKIEVYIIRNDDSKIIIEKKYDEFSGLRNTLFHKHIDIPIEVVTGEYTLKFKVIDKAGGISEETSELELLDAGSEAPEANFTEFEGIKLIVTYLDTNEIDMREPHSDRNDVLKSKSNDNKIAQNLYPFVSNAIVYNDKEINYIDTGLELHYDHFHTGPVYITTSTSVKNPSSPYWRNFFSVSLGQTDGEIVYSTAESIMNGSSATTIKNATTPHDGLVASLAGEYFAVTDIEKDSKVRSMIKVIKTSGETVAKLDGFKSILSRGNVRSSIGDLATFGTDKGLLKLRIGYSTNNKLENNYVAYPKDFNNEPFDNLISKRATRNNDIIGVKNNKGIYQIDVVNDKITQLLSINTISQIVYNLDETLCYIHTTDNKLKVYDTNSYTKIAETDLLLNQEGYNPRIVVTRKFVYASFKGSKDVYRFGANDLKQYKSISLKNRVSDIGVAGNLEEVVINNH